MWSPGYYGIGDYAGNLASFHARDGTGHSLPWERVTKNTWRVVAGNASSVEVSYDIFGNTSFAANKLPAPASSTLPNRAIWPSQLTAALG